MWCRCGRLAPMSDVYAKIARLKREIPRHLAEDLLDVLAFYEAEKSNNQSNAVSNESNAFRKIADGLEEAIAVARDEPAAFDKKAYMRSYMAKKRAQKARGRIG